MEQRRWREGEREGRGKRMSRKSVTGGGETGVGACERCVKAGEMDETARGNQ